MPYTVAKGYTLTAVQGSYSYSQDAIIRLFYDTVFASSFGVPTGGYGTYVAEILGWGTSLLDPIGASAHLYDLQISNQGGDTLEGASSVVALLEEVGTDPISPTKKVKCKFCGYEWTVSNTITLVECPNCGEKNLYASLAKFKGTV